jgi:hypothetical protein
MKQFTLVIAVLSLLIQSANAQTELSFNKLDSLLKYAENNSITIKTGEQQSLLAKWQKISAQAGLLALGSGLACGAEVILIPEVMEHEEELDRFIQKGIANK